MYLTKQAIFIKIFNFLLKDSRVDVVEYVIYVALVTYVSYLHVCNCIVSSNEPSTMITIIMQK